MHTFRSLKVAVICKGHSGLPYFLMLFQMSKNGGSTPRSPSPEFSSSSSSSDDDDWRKQFLPLSEIASNFCRPPPTEEQLEERLMKVGLSLDLPPSTVDFKCSTHL